MQQQEKTEGLYIMWLLNASEDNGLKYFETSLLNVHCSDLRSRANIQTQT